ncbi:LytR/AlgR family response regulator transcription factor [Cecembia lonarensis]|uniref:Putative transcriptional regulatory protein YehT n=1 Tax=Cecembia lonarensis (strain CCUG 58316 / KCTC 22772 / LW9) TaxID=1225176 RepID=K1LCW5_CECL9|nr:LytTR family transcriptional regulator DNA-binding domain-containing protein [Cecembia lonarensis]EKB48223.1 putative transcriptional regulatory protein YehT [Cecembia lonarensis LW9]
MRLKTLIIDDEPLATTIIQEYLMEYPEVEVCAVVHNGFDGMKAIQTYQPDFIFLDIEMPKINGFELLELLESPPAIIFTTAFDQYAVKAFDNAAVDYLLKPFSKSRFAQAMAKIDQSLAQFAITPTPESLSRIVLKDKGEIKIIPVSIIRYLEANDDYVNIHTEEGKFLKNKTLKSYEQSLASDEFVRVHRSYLVKVSEIVKMEPYEKEGFILLLRKGEKIPVSKNGYFKLKKVLGI